MTVCGHSYSGLCGACEHLQVCRNSELAKVPMTNEEWFCSLSTEEKAEWLQEHADCIGCPASCEKCHRYYDACKETMLEWLKQPHAPKE